MGQAANARIDAIRVAVDDRLRVLVDGMDRHHSRTADAMRYSLLAPGKRVRATVTILVAECFGAERDISLIPACAIEMAHAASLILDDLPCMDDANMRRGLPANHIAYGEDIAVLAAFGLLNHGYGIIGSARGIAADTRVRLLSLLTDSIGLDGLIGGQEQDLRGTNGREEPASVDAVHSRKTGALFVAAAEAGAIVAGASQDQTGRILEFAARLGMAFQTLDDFVDAFACATSAGKDTRQDIGRPNRVTMVGRDRALKNLVLQVQRANDAIQPFGEDAVPLGQLAQSLVDGAFQLAESAAPAPAIARSY